MTTATQALPQWLITNSFFSESSISIEPAGSQFILKSNKQNDPIGSLTLSDDSQAQQTIQSVEFYEGKGGLTLVAITKSGTRYFALPGSNIELPGLQIKLSGEPIPTSLTQRQAVSESSTQTLTTQAMVLGAGLATRFEPVSGERTQYSKPAVPLVGDVSVIGAISNHLVHHGFQKILVNTYFKPDSLKGSLKNVNAEVKFFDEPAPSGTAGMLKEFLLHPDKYNDYLDQTKPLFMLYGDAVTDTNWSAIVDAHVKNNAAVTIGCMVKSDEDVSKFGIAATDQSGDDKQSGNITLFLEKPTLEDAGPHRLANTGFYVFAPEIYPVIADCYRELLAKAQQDAKAQGKPEPVDVAFDYAMDIFPYVLEKIKAGAVKNANGDPMTLWAEMVDGYWNDIGNPTQYIQSVRDIYEGLTHIPLPKNVSEYYDDGVIFWPGGKVRAKKDQAKLSGNIVVALAFS